jgi:hypothetical protein
MISDTHRDQLRRSGISDLYTDKLIEENYLRTVEDASELGMEKVSGLGFCYPNGEGPSNFWRVRLDEERASQKYIQPPKSGCRLYVPPYQTHQPQGIVITEGEKKALAAAERIGRVMKVVGIGGVWSWIKEKGSRELLADLISLGIKNKPVYIVFDSDVAFKRECLKAEASLVRALKGYGAMPKVVQLEQDYKGLDDWLVAWGENWKEPLRSLFADALSERTGVKANLYKQVYNFKGMLSAEFETPKFFVGDETFGLVGEGMLTFIHSKTNVGKTYLATQMATCIALGMNFLGVTCGPSGIRVLVLQGELPASLFARGRLKPVDDYLRFLCADLNCLNNTMFLNWEFNLAETSKYKDLLGSNCWLGFERLEGLLNRYEPQVLVIDPLQSYHNILESDNNQNRELIKRLKRIARERKMAVVVVDHDRKTPGIGVDSLRGASVKAELCDTVLALKPHEMSKDVWYLSYDKIRYIDGPKPEPTRIVRGRYGINGTDRNAPFYHVEEEYDEAEEGLEGATDPSGDGVPDGGLFSGRLDA